MSGLQPDTTHSPLVSWLVSLKSCETESVGENEDRNLRATLRRRGTALLKSSQLGIWIFSSFSLPWFRALEALKYL